MADKAMRTASIEAALHWESRDAGHCERMHFPTLAIDAERLPAALAQWLPHAAAGQTYTLALSPVTPGRRFRILETRDSSHHCQITCLETSE